MYRGRPTVAPVTGSGASGSSSRGLRRAAALCLATGALLLLPSSAGAATFSANPGSLGAIPDGTSTTPGSYGSPRNVTFTVSGLPVAPPSDVGVTFRLNPAHTWAGDLDVTLIAPDGTTSTPIFSRTGANFSASYGDGSDVAGPYTFSDSAPASPTWWGAAGAADDTTAIPSSSYRASTPGGSAGGGANTLITPAFSGLSDPNGTWTLRFRDGFQGDTGAVLAASLDVTTLTTQNIAANPASLGAIPDGPFLTPGFFGTPRNVTFTVSGFAGPPRGVGVTFTLNPPHTRRGDLNVILTAPDGTTSQTIFSRTGATTSDSYGSQLDVTGPYTFSDWAPASPTWWQAATPGSYRASTPGGSAGGGANTLITPAFAGLSNPNGTWTLSFYDGASGDTGAVSAASLDITTTAAPTLTGTNPASPANDNVPKVQGSAAPGSTVKLYTTFDCSGPPAATGTAAELAGAGIAISVPDDSSTQIRATATDVDTSPCSGPITYVEDSTSPAAPTLTGTNPASPANDISPKVQGSAARGSTVKLYTTSDCSGPPAASGSAADLAGAGISITVPDGSSTQIRATATDEANNTSVCSNPITYVEEDLTPPAAPSLTGTNPASPADDNTPKVQGTAEAGSTVKLYTTSDCSGSPAATGTAAELAGAGIAISVPDNSSTDIRATATDASLNTSSCSAPITYVEHSTLPVTTTFNANAASLGAIPDGPGAPGTTGTPRDVTFTVSGFSAVAPSDVGVAFTLSPAHTRVGDLVVNLIAPDGTSSTVILAEAGVTGAGSYGDDSDVTGPYTFSDSAPASPTWWEAAAAVNGNTAIPSGSYRASRGAFDGGANKLITTEFSGLSNPNGMWALRFRDRASGDTGAVSAASLNITAPSADTTPPAAPSLTGTLPASPANDNTPKVQGAAEAGSTVKLYTTSDCSGAPAASGTAAELAGAGIAMSVPDDSSTQIRATATDASLNTSSCSDPITYVEDSTAPETTIAKHPRKRTTKRTATFEFSSSEPNASFQCKLDDKAFTACASPKTYRRLKPGRHTFQVIATDEVGNPDPVPAAFGWKVLG